MSVERSSAEGTRGSRLRMAAARPIYGYLDTSAGSGEAQPVAVTAEPASLRSTRLLLGGLREVSEDDTLIRRNTNRLQPRREGQSMVLKVFVAMLVAIPASYFLWKYAVSVYEEAERPGSNPMRGLRSARPRRNTPAGRSGAWDEEYFRQIRDPRDEDRPS